MLHISVPKYGQSLGWEPAVNWKIKEEDENSYVAYNIGWTETKNVGKKNKKLLQPFQTVNILTILPLLVWKQ